MPFQTRNRYAAFVPPARVRPLKRLAAAVARWLPRRLQFPLLGLAPPAGNEEDVTVTDEVVTLRDGVACVHGAHLNRSRCYVPQATLGTPAFVEACFLKEQRLLPRVHRIRERVLSLAADGDLNYYRWLMETLPRTRFIRDFAGGDERIYCRQDAPFHRATLQALGCDASRLIASHARRCLQSHSIRVPRFVDEAEEWVIPWLRDHFLPPAGGSEAALPRRIYLSRAKATGRRVSNEAALLEGLTARGFERVYLEDRAWLDQVRLLRDAEIVIGPHGAGFANLVFCRPGTQVVEWIAANYPFTFFPEISRRLQLEHHLMECTPARPAHIHSSDLEVDLQTLWKLLPSRA